MASKKPAGKAGQGPALQTAYLNTDSGPASGPAGTARQPAAKRAAAVDAMAGAIPHNAGKAAEYGEEAARCPYAGEAVPAPAADVAPPAQPVVAQVETRDPFGTPRLSD